MCIDFDFDLHIVFRCLDIFVSRLIHDRSQVLFSGFDHLLCSSQAKLGELLHKSFSSSSTQVILSSSVLSTAEMELLKSLALNHFNQTFSGSCLCTLKDGISSLSHFLRRVIPVYSHICRVSISHIWYWLLHCSCCREILGRCWSSNYLTQFKVALW